MARWYSKGDAAYVAPSNKLQLSLAQLNLTRLNSIQLSKLCKSTQFSDSKLPTAMWARLTSAQTNF